MARTSAPMTPRDDVYLAGPLRPVHDPSLLLPENPPEHDYYDVYEEEESSLGAEAALGLVGLALAGVGAYLAYRYYFSDNHARPARGGQGGRVFRDGRGPDPSELYDKGLHLHEAVTIDKPRDELYAWWRDLTNQPRIMPHLESVVVHGDAAGVGGRSTWTASTPAGVTFTYDAETIADEPGRLLSWRTVGHSAFEHVGTARFTDAPGGRGTEVHVEVQYLPPVGGKVAAFGRSLLGLVGQDPDRQVRRGLRNFKRLMETGELPTTEGQPKGD